MDKEREVEIVDGNILFDEQEVVAERISIQQARVTSSSDPSREGRETSLRDASAAEISMLCRQAGL